LDTDLTEIIFGTSPTPTPTITRTKTPTPTVTSTPAPSTFNCLNGLKIVFRYNHVESNLTPIADRCPCEGIYTDLGNGFKLGGHMCFRARFIMKLNGVIVEPTNSTCFDGQNWGVKTWSINTLDLDDGVNPNCGDQCYDSPIGGVNSDFWNGCRDDFNFPPGQNLSAPWGTGSVRTKNFNRYSYTNLNSSQAASLAALSPDGCIDFALQCWMPSNRCCNHGLTSIGGDTGGLTAGLCSNGNNDEADAEQFFGECHQDIPWIQIYRNINGVETLIYNKCPSSRTGSPFFSFDPCSGDICTDEIPQPSPSPTPTKTRPIT
jgi:hypothetical protein